MASFPPTVARTQLPSPSALSIGVVIWYTELLETPSLAQGTNPSWMAPHKGPYTGTIGTLAGAGRNRGVVFLRSELHFISQGDNRGYQREVEWPVT